MTDRKKNRVKYTDGIYHFSTKTNKNKTTTTRLLSTTDVCPKAKLFLQSKTQCARRFDFYVFDFFLIEYEEVLLSVQTDQAKCHLEDWNFMSDFTANTRLAGIKQIWCYFLLSAAEWFKTERQKDRRTMQKVLCLHTIISLVVMSAGMQCQWKWIHIIKVWLYLQLNFSYVLVYNSTYYPGCLIPDTRLLDTISNNKIGAKFI